jgi:FtsP/CotA-like multicopper oxidase with cupredoxin domain
LKALRFAGLVVALVFFFARTDAQAPDAASSLQKVHTYYIAADEVQWDYAPHAKPLFPGGDSDLVRLPREISTIYTKALYREYTDDTFKTLKPRLPEWEHLGILGPLIRAEVGDTIKVVFKNNTRLIVTMHPHGLAYDKDSEGAYYSQAPGTPPDRTKKGNAVQHGEVFTYTWTVPESAGPGPGDPSSMLWMYHSHFVESRDMNTGLLGPIIVSRKGTAKPDGTPKDVDREFVVAFAIFQEGESAFFMNNIVQPQQYKMAEINDPNFIKTLEHYTMNGYIRATLPLLTMKKGERVRWYLLANSNEDDVHAPHWHGQTVLVNGMRSDTIAMGPMSMVVADMVADNPGVWMFHCHVNDHLDRGMYGLFKVIP